MFINRREAINLFKEIQDKIPELYFNSIALNESEPNHALLTGYALYLMGLSDECRRKARKIVNDLGFAAKEEKDELIIFSNKS